jgi:GTP-binding protein EngB required for normal cell division
MHILINKIDKLGKNQRGRVLSEVSKRIKGLGTDNISAQLFSAAKRIGSEEAWTVLADWLSDELK